MKPLFKDAEWSHKSIKETWDAIHKIGTEDYKLDYYPVQLEIISSEQMLDAYSSHAMPNMYSHWSFGKSFIQNQQRYTKGQQGLAYEVVINTNPCIAYLMEDNTMTMQALVMAHAGVGHNSFFANNYMFKEWTDASTILSYLQYSKEFIAKAETELGELQVESILDCCHALQYYGVNKYKRKYKTKDDNKKRKDQRQKFIDEDFNDVWRTIPEGGNSFYKYMKNLCEKYKDKRPKSRNPEENILYFLRKYSPVLSDTEREILKIVSNIAQYFYPQMQTQLMNEGWATFIHYEIMTTMEERGLITPGQYLEFIISHTGVVAQPGYDSKYYSGINVYALGFAMFRDLKRICLEPTEEDKHWFPDLAGTEDWLQALKDIAFNYKDESFVLQYLSPKVIRDLKLFCVLDSEQDNCYIITGIHDDESVSNIRQAISDQYNLGLRFPDIEIYQQDNLFNNNDPLLILSHNVRNSVTVEEKSLLDVLDYIHNLWGSEPTFTNNFNSHTNKEK